jgi:hypothetical protein
MVAGGISAAIELGRCRCVAVAAVDNVTFAAPGAVNVSRSLGVMH